MTQEELEQMEKLNIIYDSTARLTELYRRAILQLAQRLLGYSLPKTKKIVREYLEMLDKKQK